MSQQNPYPAYQQKGGGTGVRLPYMPGVDGLRALAVATVFMYHAGATWLPGGFLGVDFFLVISGYLITSLLVAEQQGTGRLDLWRFWLRRARRLLPALFLALAGTLVAMLILHWEEVARLKGAVLASLAYVTNWYFVVADVPYFEQFGRPNVFTHLWSLAVEEQFYLFWPLVLAVVLIVFRLPVWVLGVLAAAGATFSTWWAWHLYDPYELPWRIYYGTDTRAVGLFVGILGAVLLPPGRLKAMGSWVARAGMEVLGLAALAGVLWCMFTINEFESPLYQGNAIAHSADVWGFWNDLEQRVRGGPGGGVFSPEGPARQHAHRDFILAMHNMAMAGRATELADRVDLTGRRALVDVGIPLSVLIPKPAFRELTAVVGDTVWVWCSPEATEVF